MYAFSPVNMISTSRNYVAKLGMIRKDLALLPRGLSSRSRLWKTDHCSAANYRVLTHEWVSKRFCMSAGIPEACKTRAKQIDIDLRSQNNRGTAGELSWRWLYDLCRERIVSHSWLWTQQWGKLCYRNLVESAATAEPRVLAAASGTKLQVAEIWSTSPKSYCW